MDPFREEDPEDVRKERDQLRVEVARLRARRPMSALGRARLRFVLSLFSAVAVGAALAYTTVVTKDAALVAVMIVVDVGAGFGAAVAIFTSIIVWAGQSDENDRVRMPCEDALR